MLWGRSPGVKKFRARACVRRARVFRAGRVERKREVHHLEEHLIDTEEVHTNGCISRRLSIKLCLSRKSSSFLKAGLEHGVELRKGGGNVASDDSPSTILQR
jgi:hypothetical protein